MYVKLTLARHDENRVFLSCIPNSTATRRPSLVPNFEIWNVVVEGEFCLTILMALSAGGKSIKRTDIGKIYVFLLSIISHKCINYGGVCQMSNIFFYNVKQ